MLRVAAKLRPVGGASALRRMATKPSHIDDIIPMSIADRAMAAAVKSGSLSKLEGEGKPLRNDPETSQVHIGAMPKNMEGRAEAEMRRAAHVGLLNNLAGEGAPLDEEYQARSAAVGASGISAQERIQMHAQKSTARSKK